MKRTLVIGEETHHLEISRRRGRIYMTIDGDECEVDIIRVEPTGYSVIIDGYSVGVNVDRLRCQDPDLHGFRTSLYDGAYEFTLQDPHKELLAAAMARSKRNTGGDVRAQMPGKVAKLLVQEGEAIEEGQPIFILEAMKMQNEVLSPFAGKVEQVVVEEGQNVEFGGAIMTLVAEEPKA